MQRGDFSTDRRLFGLVGLAVVIGGIAACSAVLLLSMIAFFTNLFFHARLSTVPAPPGFETLGWVAALMPILGGALIGLLARFGSERIRGHGIPEALEAILFGKSVMSPKVAVLKPLSSAISIGSGGPFGAEGPIIMTGGAIGSIIAQAFHLTAAERKTLLVAGAAAGMSAVFATPMAAILLAVELLLFEWKPRSLVPVAVASIVAAVLRVPLLGEGPLFAMVGTGASMSGMSGGGILFDSLVVGLVAGLASACLSAVLYRLEDAFHRLPMHWMYWPATGGVVVGLGGLLQPRALGVGYDVIGDLLNGRIPITGVVAIAVVKAVIWLVALASGTSGGVLAPLLILGCALGSFEAGWFPPETHALWPLVSMAAILGGMMRSPLMAVVFALELTHDMDALFPLLVASMVAYALTVLIMKRSILTEKISRRGHDIFREYWVDPLERSLARHVMSERVETIPGELRLAEVRDRYFGSGRKHRGYPVTRDDGRVVGMLTAADLDRMQGEATAGSVARRALVSCRATDSCRVVAERMAREGVGRVVVLSEAGGLLGIITRSDLLKATLAHWREESLRERWPA